MSQSFGTFRIMSYQKPSFPPAKEMTNQNWPLSECKFIMQSTKANAASVRQSSCTMQTYAPTPKTSMHPRNSHKACIITEYGNSLTIYFMGITMRHPSVKFLFLLNFLRKKIPFQGHALNTLIWTLAEMTSLLFHFHMKAVNADIQTIFLWRGLLEWRS